MLRSFVLLLMATAIFGCNESVLKNSPAPAGPAVEREFRGVWVATVGNIDWPSKPGLSVQQQQEEARAILDTVRALNMNAVVFQVRPHCDALYQSALEPWSFYLTGEQGRAPEPFYDPLQFWIDEAHQRGLELHAWFNPYRAHLTRGNEITDSSIVRKRPDIARKINDGMYWLDPSRLATQDHSYAVVMDVVRRYDIDGVHFDDYFYPYNDGKFPDDDSWEEYTAGGGNLTREDWRRSHVNTFIERVYRGIKKEKKHVKFGLSPFGIWRPRNPASIAGYDQYNMLYADAKLWLNEGWVDYFTPQLYWPVNQVPQSFPVLLGWWTRENTMGRNLWPGMIISRPREEKTADEIFNQIMITRGFVPEGPGHIHFSMKSFMRDSSAVNSALRYGPYKRQAIVPASPWLDDTAPSRPALTVRPGTDTISVEWTHAEPGDVFRTVVYQSYNSVWEYTIVNGAAASIQIPRTRITRKETRNRNGETTVTETPERLDAISVSAVDRMGNESTRLPYVIDQQQ
ncbi:MAG: family 10 glycosylhydrolase [Bacteroidetes bacterium]|nr:family 10 glycosylhydrolase [Bacteroidota bacterium]